MSATASHPAWPLADIGAQLDALLPGCRVELVEEIDSTNTELMRRARGGRADESVLLVALRQSAGRGRMGRPWQSQAGETDTGATLTFSLGLPLAPRDWSGLSLAVGVAVAEALDPQGDAGVALKWPNDLWRQDRKLAGILIETATTPGDTPSATRYVVIGVGINIGPRSAEGMRTPPACVREWQPDATTAGALAQIAAPLLRTVLQFAETGFAPLATRFAQRDALRGREVQLSDGTSGHCEGVGWTGELLVHTASGIQSITSSEVSVRPRAG